MNGGPCYECMEVYLASFRNCVAEMEATGDDVALVFGISADELHRRCEGGGVTREAWAALGRAARRCRVLCARRECLTCYREQWVIPLVTAPFETK